MLPWICTLDYTAPILNQHNAVSTTTSTSYSFHRSASMTALPPYMSSPSTDSSQSPRRMTGMFPFSNQMDFVEVADFFEPLTDAQVLEFCCGRAKGRYADVPDLALSTLVICLDTEGWDADSKRLKEIGINVFDSRDMAAVQSPGPWGENLLRTVFFYFARVLKNAHFVNRNAAAGNPEKNRFGQQRFLDDEEVVNFLTEMFEWPLNPASTDGKVCPVVLLGHAIDNDVPKLQELLGFTARNVVRQIDTQQIVRDVGHWKEPKNQIGLKTLASDMGFTFIDPHTASNDAAYTLIAAVQLILPQIYRPKQPEDMDDMIENLARNSKEHDWYYGSAAYCFRCGSRYHMARNGGKRGGVCVEPVSCDWCREDRPGKQYGHRTEACVMKAFETSNSARRALRQKGQDLEETYRVRRLSSPETPSPQSGSKDNSALGPRAARTWSQIARR